MMKATTNDVERELARTALLAIIDRNFGVLNPRLVLNDAADPTHPLHRYFEWDDAAAGDAYRLAQVGALVRHVRITTSRKDAVTREVTLTTTRAFQSRPSMRRASGGYEPVETILADEDKRGELLGQVLRELSAYRKRYAELSELQPIWIAVDEATSDYHPSPSATPDGEPRHGAAG